MAISRDKLGFWLAVVTAALALTSFAMALFGTPSYKYPFPYDPPIILADYLWLIPAFVLMSVFVMLISFIHNQAAEGKKVFSHIALSFAIMCAVLLMADFFIQWTVVLPSVQNEETEGLVLFTQYNPHGLFVAIESLAYLLMSVTLLFLAPLFNGGRRQRAVRWLFVASFILTAGGFVGFTLAGLDVVQFEVLAITVNWTVLILGGILMALAFRRGEALGL